MRSDGGGGGGRDRGVSKTVLRAHGEIKAGRSGTESDIVNAMSE